MSLDDHTEEERRRMLAGRLLRRAEAFLDLGDLMQMDAARAELETLAADDVQTLNGMADTMRAMADDLAEMATKIVDAKTTPKGAEA